MRGAIRSAALLLFFVCTSGAAAAQPPKDATLRVTVLDQSGAVNFDPAHVVGVAVRLRSGVSMPGTASTPPDGAETVIEIDSVED